MNDEAQFLQWEADWLSGALPDLDYEKLQLTHEDFRAWAQERARHGTR